MIKLNYIALCLLLVCSSVVIAQPHDIKEQAIDDARSLSTDDYPSIEKFHDALRLQLQGKTDAAQKLFIECLETQPNNDAIHFALGNIALSNKLTTKAKKYYEKAYALDNTNTYYAEALAMIYLELGNFKDAEPLWQALVKDQARNVDFQYFLGQCFIYNRKYNEAIETFNTVENLMGVIPQISTIKIQLLDELKQNETILVELKKLRYADPYNPETQNFVLSYFQKENALLPFFKRLEDELKAEYPNPSTFTYILKNTSLSDSVYKICMSKGLEQKVFPQLTIAENLAKLNSKKILASDSIQQLAQQLLTDNPDSPKILDAVEEYFEQSTSISNIITLAKQKVNSDPNNFDSWKNLISKELKMGLFIDMLATTEEALEYFPLMPQLYYLNAQALIFNGKMGDAIEMFETGKSYYIADNEETAFLEQLTSAQIELAQGKEDVFQKQYTKLKETTKHSEYLTDFALSCNFIMGSQIAPLKIDLNSSFFKAHKLYVVGEFGKAQKLLVDLLDVYPEHGNAHDLLGDIYFKQSLPNKAFDEWKLAKQHGTNNQNIAKKIETKTLHESKYY